MDGASAMAKLTSLVRQDMMKALTSFCRFLVERRKDQIYDLWIWVVKRVKGKYK